MLYFCRVSVHEKCQFTFIIFQKKEMHQLVLWQNWINELMASSKIRLNLFFSWFTYFQIFCSNELAFLLISKSKIHQMKDLKHHVFILLANSACENSNSHCKHCFVLWCSYESRSEREEVKRQIMRKRKLPSRYLLLKEIISWKIKQIVFYEK